MSKKVIKIQQKAVRVLAEEFDQISRRQLDPLITSIETYLKGLYPNIKNDEATDWALEFVNFPNNYTEVFNRMDKIFKNQYE